MGNVEKRNNFLLERLKVEGSIENFVNKKLQIKVTDKKTKKLEELGKRG